MKILIVNLARAKDRRQFMQKQLTELGLEFQFIEGTDYREMREEDFRAHCSPRALTGDNYLKGVFAASLSHLTAYKTILSEQLDGALVCEDDAVFPPNSKEILAQVQAAMRPDEIVLLSYYSHTKKPLVLSQYKAQELQGGRALLSPLDITQVASAMAYIVPRAVAQTLVETLLPVDHVPDNWGAFYTKGAVQKLRCLYPQVMKDAPFASVVEYPGSKKWHFRLRAWLRKNPLLNKWIGAIGQKKALQKYAFTLVAEKPAWGNEA